MKTDERKRVLKTGCFADECENCFYCRVCHPEIDEEYKEMRKCINDDCD